MSISLFFFQIWQRHERDRPLVMRNDYACAWLSTMLSHITVTLRLFTVKTKGQFLEHFTSILKRCILSNQYLLIWEWHARIFSVSSFASDIINRRVSWRETRSRKGGMSEIPGRLCITNEIGRCNRDASVIHTSRKTSTIYLLYESSPSLFPSHVKLLTNP